MCIFPSRNCGSENLYLTKADRPFVFRDLDAFTPGISRLVFMLDYARRTTLNAFRG